MRHGLFLACALVGQAFSFPSWGSTLWKCVSDNGAITYSEDKSTSEKCSALSVTPEKPSKVVAIQPTKAAAKQQVGRKLTGEECARMERLVPETANYLGMRGNGMKLIEKGRNGDFPEATEVMVRWVNQYDPESLLKYGYQMAPDFYKKCKSGAIRVPI